jgi:sphingolipid delta-4 desaturase
MRQFEFIRDTGPEPHRVRTAALLKKYPELRKLFGHQRSSALIIVAIVALQIAVAFVVSTQPWWVMLIAAYTVGAVSNHALFVFIHEATHNLVFRSTWANKVIGMIANLPIVFPAALGFRKYHLVHHQFQGDFDRDADLSGPREAAWVGNSPVRKALWLLTYAFTEGVIRPQRIKYVKLWDGWILANLLVQVVFAAAIFWMWGGLALAYLTLSLFFSVGLHPLGARWIQEHFVVKQGQETYSYYGPANKIAFNVGFHNEHHDLVMVPWSKLPRVRAMAPEFYDSLYWHPSWTKLLLQFLFDRNLSLYSRVVRPNPQLQTGVTEVTASMIPGHPLQKKVSVQSAPVEVAAEPALV